MKNLLNSKKTKIILSFFTVSAVTIEGILAIYLTKKYSPLKQVKGDEITYSLVLNSNNRLTSSTSYSSGSAHAHTSTGNTIGFDYSNIKLKQNGFQTLKSSIGNFNNNEHISGIKSLSFSSNNNNSITLKHGWYHNTLNRVNQLAPEEVFTFNNKGPSFFSLSNETSNDYDLDEVRVIYNCIRTNEPTYVVRWKNYDGTILEEDLNVIEGLIPIYDGETPTRADTNSYYYAFNGWNPNVVPAYQNQDYTATYNRNIKIRQVSAGRQFGIGLGYDGKIYSWGRNNYGQLGSGNYTNCLTPQPISYSNNFSALSVGADTGYGLTNSGKIVSWGRNNYGQLGDGTTQDRPYPVMINVPGKTFVKVEGGLSHAIALTSNGQIYTWGRGLKGALGNNSTSNASTPTLINVTGKTFVAVKAGNLSSYALCSDDYLYSWGWNSYGQLGLGNYTNKLVPTRMNTYYNFQKIYAGTTDCLAIDGIGRIYNWGYNGSGQLGNGTTNGANYPQLVNMGSKRFKDAATRSNHSVILTTTGQVYAAGFNAYGELGDGTTTMRKYFVPINVNGQTVSSLGAGFYNSFFVTNNARVYGTGYNGNGALGDGTTTNRSSPTLIQFVQ